MSGIEARVRRTSDNAIIIPAQGMSATNFTDVWIDNPGPGNFSYVLEIRRVNEADNTTVHSLRRLIIGLVVKK